MGSEGLGNICGIRFIISSGGIMVKALTILPSLSERSQRIYGGILMIRNSKKENYGAFFTGRILFSNLRQYINELRYE